MAILDFPNSPTSGTTYNAPNGATYTYDGAAWTCTSGGAGGGALGTQSIYTANATLTTANHDSLINANAADVQLTLPAFSTALSGQVFRITRVDAQAARQATIMPAGTDTIDGVNASITIAPNESATLMACGTVANARNWVRVADPTWRTIQSSNTLTPGDGNKVLVSQAAGNAMQWGARTAKARVAAGLVADTFHSAHVSLNTVHPYSTSDDTASASWLLRLASGSGADNVAIFRAPATAGAPALTTLFQIDSAGMLYALGSDATKLPALILGWGTAKSRVQVNNAQPGNVILSANRDWTANAQDDATKPSWGLFLRLDTDQLAVQRSPAGSTAQTNLLLVDNAGNLTINGATGTKASGTTWANPSDPRLKTDVAPYAKGLTEVCQLEPITYRLKANPEPLCYGFDAAAVQPIFPECVTETSMRLDPDDPEPTEGVLSFDIHPILVALVNAVQELAARVGALEVHA